MRRAARLSLAGRVVSPLCALALASAALLAGCGGKPFNVKRRPDVPPATAYDARDQSEYLVLEASPVRDEDFLYETFDANLILAGILPVRVRITNLSAEPMELKRGRFEVRAADNRLYKRLEGRKAYKRVVSYYGISVYTKEGYKESQNDFASHDLDLGEPLPGGESRQGVMFFAVPSDIAREGKLSLLARKLKPKSAKSDRAIELSLK